MKILGTEKMLALSWKQPFATAMLHGKIETRTWNTNYRGLVLICASKLPYINKVILNITGERQYIRLMELFFGGLVLGQAIAVGRLVDCRPMQLADEDKCFVKYHSDLFCHIYEEVQAIKPFAWKGSQGWKIVEQSIVDAIEII